MPDLNSDARSTETKQKVVTVNTVTEVVEAINLLEDKYFTCNYFNFRTSIIKLLSALG